jgi:outer membrane autotransporter protein
LGSGASLINNGTIDSTDGTAATGIAATVRSLTGGDVSISGSGSFLGRLGINAIAMGAGTATINVSGMVHGAGISTVDGDLMLTFGDVVGQGGGNGIDARSTTGKIDLLVNGHVTGGNISILEISAGAKSITIGTTGRVDGGGATGVDIAFSGDGNNSLTNNGTIGAAGDTAILAGGAGTTSITNSSTGTISGSVLLGDADDSIGNFGTLNLDGVNLFGGGTDVISNRSTGIVNLVSTSSFSGLETIDNAGRINVGTGTISLAATTINNLAGGQIVATSGISRIAGALGLNNAGTIVLGDNQAGDRLTIDGNYAGLTGGSLSIDVASDLSIADVLIINGAATGTTTVNANILPTNGVINMNGVLVVDAAAGTSANAFVLGPVTGAGLVDYAIEQRGDDFFLIGEANPTVGELSALGLVGPDLWYQSFDSQRGAVAGRSIAGREGRKLGYWGQLYAINDRYGNHTVTDDIFGADVSFGGRIRHDGFGAQGGIDLAIGPVVVGVTGGYEHDDAEVGQSSGIRAKGYNYGAYALFGGEAGIYGSLTVKRDNYDLRFDNIVRNVFARPDGHATGVDAQVGYRAAYGGALVDLNAGLSGVRAKVDGFTVDATRFSLDSTDSLRGRASARVIAPRAYGAFIDTTLFHEFDGDSTVNAVNGTTSDSFGEHGKGTWGRIEAGLGASLRRGPIVSAYVQVGDVQGFGGRGTFRF